MNFWKATGSSQACCAHLQTLAYPAFYSSRRHLVPCLVKAVQRPKEPSKNRKGASRTTIQAVRRLLLTLFWKGWKSFIPVEKIPVYPFRHGKSSYVNVSRACLSFTASPNNDGQQTHQTQQHKHSRWRKHTDFFISFRRSCETLSRDGDTRTEQHTWCGNTFWRWDWPRCVEVIVVIKEVLCSWAMLLSLVGLLLKCLYPKENSREFCGWTHREITEDRTQHPNRDRTSFSCLEKLLMLLQGTKRKRNSEATLTEPLKEGNDLQEVSGEGQNRVVSVANEQFPRPQQKAPLAAAIHVEEETLGDKAAALFMSFELRQCVSPSYSSPVLVIVLCILYIVVIAVVVSFPS